MDGDVAEEKAVGEKAKLLLPLPSFEDRRSRGEGFDLS
jgi:hypothetical protein